VEIERRGSKVGCDAAMRAYFHFYSSMYGSRFIVVFRVYFKTLSCVDKLYRKRTRCKEAIWRQTVSIVNLCSGEIRLGLSIRRDAR
jgi:hypothetical protein